MSDVEEPPTKMSKYEEYLDPEGEECLEEGQEEWLSEGVLTDDDYIPTVEQEDKSNDNDQPVKKEELKTELNDESNTIQTTTVIGQVELHDKSIINASITHGSIAHSNVSHNILTRGNGTQNIEEQLNNLESTQNGDELTDDLDAFLIRKTDGQVLEAKVKEETDDKMKQETDGNNTDDLLRMLGEGDQKMKKKTFKMIKSEKNDDHSSDDDDDFIYERSKVKTLKLAKNALIKRTATKAIPENMSDGDDETDQSSDEGNTVQRMFEVKAPSSGKKTEPKKIVKHVVQVNTGFNRSQKPDQKVNHRTYTGPKPGPKSSKQTAAQKQSKSVIEVKTPAPFKPLDKSTSNEKNTKSESKDATSKNDDFDEVIDGEEFLEDEVSELDEEEFGEDSEGGDSKKQRIMKPEMMDEEVPSDAESHSEDGSIYDELPSSDSDDLDDWFTLDIRAERAGDYLPLLGTKARELLLAERSRVSSRVQTLHQSLSALTDSARRQAEQLKAASMALAEIDDTLRAS